MGETVADLRNEIRAAAGRFEREIDAAFTKEDLAAIHEAVGAGAVGDPLPTKGAMRAEILAAIGEQSGDGGDLDRTFRKAELVAIRDAATD